MGQDIRTGARPHDGRRGSLGELIHAAVRQTIEAAVDEELTAALGARPYERGGQRRGYRNGTKPRTVTGPTGPLALTVPRGSLFTATGSQEWASRLLPRYERRLPEVNETVIATYLAGANTRRLRGALRPLLKERGSEHDGDHDDVRVGAGTDILTGGDSAVDGHRDVLVRQRQRVGMDLRPSGPVAPDDRPRRVEE